MSALDLTGANLIRALGDIAGRPALARAMRAKAEALAEALQEEARVETRIEEKGDGLLVTAAAPGLFSREFGSLTAPARPAIAGAIGRLKRGGTP
jgi:hypothetical protein